LDHPEYRGKPVIVGADPAGGKGRGVVSAASYAARRFGVHSALPVSRAFRLCPQGIFVAPRMERYVEVSRAVFAIFRNYTDLVEGLSLDEAFLDVTGSVRLFGDGPQIGRKIKEEIRTGLGLISSVGIAPTKFVAKIASDIEKPDGFVVVGEEEVGGFLRPLPVSRLWGVGEKTAEVLKRRGLTTIGDVAAINPKDLAAILGEHGLHLSGLARGMDPRPVVPDLAAKSIGNEVTFDGDTADGEVIRRTLLGLADRVAARLRAEGVKAAGLTLKFRDEEFKTITRSLLLGSPSNVTDDLYKAALELLLRTGWKGERKVRLLGLTAGRLETKVRGQEELFADLREREKHQSAEGAVDAIRRKFGRGLIRRAALVKNPKS